MMSVVTAAPKRRRATAKVSTTTYAGRERLRSAKADGTFRADVRPVVAVDEREDATGIDE